MLTTAERQEIVKEYITREGIVSTDIPAQLERVVIYAAAPQIFTLMGTDISLFETIVRGFRNTYVDAYADGIVRGVLLAKSQKKRAIALFFYFTIAKKEPFPL